MRVPTKPRPRRGRTLRRAKFKGNCDRQTDEGHHAGLVVGQLAPCPTNENETAVNKDHRSEDWGDQVGAGKRRRSVPKPVLDIARPENHWNCESKAQPKLVAKHGDGVSGVTVVTRVSRRHLVTGMWVRRLSSGLVRHVVHFELRIE